MPALVESYSPSGRGAKLLLLEARSLWRRWRFGGGVDGSSSTVGKT